MKNKRKEDIFNLLDFIDDIDDEYDGIFVNVQRISDKKFILPLADLRFNGQKIQELSVIG